MHNFVHTEESNAIIQGSHLYLIKTNYINASYTPLHSKKRVEKFVRFVWQSDAILDKVAMIGLCVINIISVDIAISLCSKYRNAVSRVFSNFIIRN